MEYFSEEHEPDDDDQDPRGGDSQYVGLPSYRIDGRGRSETPQPDLVLHERHQDEREAGDLPRLIPQPAAF
jgi:hypothetical protein